MTYAEQVRERWRHHGGSINREDIAYLLDVCEAAAEFFAVMDPSASNVSQRFAAASRLGSLLDKPPKDAT